MSKTTQILNEVLNRELPLYLRTWNYHWNVEGPLFPSLHALLESQYVELRGLIDEIAERVRALGEVPDTRVQLTIEGPTTTPQMLRTLAAEHSALSASIVKEYLPAIGGDADPGTPDPGTVDLLTRVLQVHDKFAWMLLATAK